MIARLLAAGLLAVAASGSARADFLNGGFESSNFTGWTLGGGTTNALGNYTVNPASIGHSAVVGAGLDPELLARGVNFQRVYNGSYSARIEDSGLGAFFSTAKQSVVWNDPSIYFAYATVFQEPGHAHADEPHFRVTLKDLTAGTTLYDVEYASDTVPPGVLKTAGDLKYTDFQVVNLDTSGAIGHTLELSLLGSDCALTGHWGYVYLDGFGSVAPPPGPVVPAPAGVLLAGFAALSLAGYRRLRRRTAA